MKSREIIKMIEKDGWKLVRVTRSHHHSKHSSKKGLVTIPHPKSEIAKVTLKSIKKQAGI